MFLQPLDAPNQNRNLPIIIEYTLRVNPRARQLVQDTPHIDFSFLKHNPIPKFLPTFGRMVVWILSSRVGGGTRASNLVSYMMAKDH